MATAMPICGSLSSRPRRRSLKDSQLFLSYVHSHSIGNLNEFSNYLANFPPAVILPDARTFLPGDTPNRMLAWGTLSFPINSISAESRVPLGFPWSSYDSAQHYVGCRTKSLSRLFLH